MLSLKTAELSEMGESASQKEFPGEEVKVVRNNGNDCSLEGKAKEEE